MTHNHYSRVSIMVLALLLAACQPVANTIETTAVEEPCMGPAKKDSMCTMQYDPVCGCNGKTYSNACVAKTAGVLRVEKGACEDEEAKARFDRS